MNDWKVIDPFPIFLIFQLSPYLPILRPIFLFSAIPGKKNRTSAVSKADGREAVDRAEQSSRFLGGGVVAHDLNVLALFKGRERFIYVYDDDSLTELLDHLRDTAADPSTVVNWFDASVLTDRARQQVAEAETPVGQAEESSRF